MVVFERLKEVDLTSWQHACKSLAPPKYSNTTREEWFEENKFRVRIGKEIIDFVEETSKSLHQEPQISSMRIADIKSAIVKGIRDAESSQGITSYLLNEVKLAALRTLVRWADSPKRMKDLEHKSTKISRRVNKRGRKKEKGKHRPPELNIMKQLEVLDKDKIRLTSTLTNNYIHPYQNITIELDIDPNLVLTRVTPYSWLPNEKLIHVGFLEAGLGIDPLDASFVMDFDVRKRSKSFYIGFKVLYDNCDRGIVDETDLSRTTLQLF